MGRVPTPHTASALADLYNRHFTVLPASSPELLDAAHALRYQVYCVEHAFEDPADPGSEREIDHYDSHSVHAVLIHVPTGQVVGCVRLILPQPESGLSTLPMRDLLIGPAQARLDTCDPARTAEISRYAVSKMFRRRAGDRPYPDVDLGRLQEHEARSLVPHVSVGLLRAVSSLAAGHGITTVCAVMAPALVRLLERFGLEFERLGPLVDHHGLRQPCIAGCEALLTGMAAHHSQFFELIDAEYHGRT